VITGNELPKTRTGTNLSAQGRSTSTFAVLAPRPAARPPFAFLELLLCPANAAFSGHGLLGILDPADELVARERCDVPPSIESRGVGDQCSAQVRGKLVYHPSRHSLLAHEISVAPSKRPRLRRQDRARRPWKVVNA
jgi:hypothetical protein